MGVRFMNVPKKITIPLSILLILGVAYLVLILSQEFSTPKIRVENISGSPVKVVARWRNKSNDLGDIKVGSIVLFEVNDEAAMSFDISYPSGKTETTIPVYFTAGTTIHLQINDTGAHVSAGT